MKFLKGVWIGFWSGMILGLLLKWVQAVTGKNVYLLLLNVDFIPVVGNIDWSEMTEFLFHVAVSVVIGIAYVYLAKRRNYTFGQLTVLSLILCSPTYFLYFILSSMAVTDQVPGLTDWEAITYWIFAHLAYSLLLPIFYKIFERKNAASQ